MSQQVQKAGAIILSNLNQKNIALLYRGKQKDWSFPKGHIDAGESLTEAMIREMKEETGLNVEIIQKLQDNVYLHSDGNTISTAMFLVKSLDDSTLRKEFEGDILEWVSYNEVENKLSYDNLKNYYKSITSVLSSIIETV